MAGRPEGDLSRLEPAVPHRGRGGPVGVARPGRGDREGRGPVTSEAPWARPRVRRRGGLLRRYRGRGLRGRRRARHPLRGPARRPRDARNALHDGGAHGAGPGGQGGSGHRRPVLGAPRAASVSAMSGPRLRRAALSRSSRTATSSASTPTPARSTWKSMRSSWRRERDISNRGLRTMPRARCGSSRSRSARHATALSPTRAPARSGSSTRISDGRARLALCVKAPDYRPAVDKNSHACHIAFAVATDSSSSGVRGDLPSQHTDAFGALRPRPRL